MSLPHDRYLNRYAKTVSTKYNPMQQTGFSMIFDMLHILEVALDRELVTCSDDVKRIIAELKSTYHNKFKAAMSGFSCTGMSPSILSKLVRVVASNDYSSSEIQSLLFTMVTIQWNIAWLVVNNILGINVSKDEYRLKLYRMSEFDVKNRSDMYLIYNLHIPSAFRYDYIYGNSVVERVKHIFPTAGHVMRQLTAVYPKESRFWNTAITQWLHDNWTHAVLRHWEYSDCINGVIYGEVIKV